MIETSRLSLRLVALSDLENIHRLLYADPEVALPWTGHVQSLAEVSAPNGVLSMISRAADEPGLLAVERAADYALIGLAGILPIRRASDRARFVPASPADVPGSVEGRVEGELVVALGFGSLRYSRIVASVGSRNERGVKLLRRLGFRTEPNQRADPDTGSSVPGTLGFLDAPS